MTPVISPEQIRVVEELTMKGSGLSVTDLMERAGSSCAARIRAWLEAGEFGSDVAFVVVAGRGNNGGDGLVIARYLRQAGLPVRVVDVAHRADGSEAYRRNLASLRQMGVQPDLYDHSSEAVHVLDNEVVIDAIFGTGFSRSLDPWLAGLISTMNNAQRPIISIDVPSGMIEPEVPTPFDTDACVRADRTLVIEVPRLSMMLPGTGEHYGLTEIIPIGLDTAALDHVPNHGYWVTAADVRAMLRQRPPFAHKGSFGHAWLVAGSAGYHGAAVLAAQGCARSGVGLLTVRAAGPILAALTVVLPDAMGSIEGDPEAWSSVTQASALGIGPGLGRTAASRERVADLLARYTGPLVLDADALNALADQRDLLDQLPTQALLTPHPKEMDRLLGHSCETPYERLRRTMEFAAQRACTVVLKGRYTAVCAPDGRVCFNTTGNVGMAKGGSGDVLTGLLAGLLAQGYSPVEAGIIGTHLHGVAGNLAAHELGVDAMRASDLVEHLAPAWKNLRATTDRP